MDRQNRPEHSFGDTIERIERLYAEKIAEAEQARVPPEQYAETSTGRHLSTLIDEMEAAGGDATLDGSNTLGALGLASGEVAHIDPTGGENVPASEVLLIDTKTPLPYSATAEYVGPEADLDEAEELDEEQELREIMLEFEHRLRRFFERRAERRVEGVERRAEDQMRRLRRAAAREVKRRQGLIKQHYEARYKKKELVLRKHYKKLMLLANKVSAQKAQLNEARREFEEKLTAANALYKEVEDLRRALREQLRGLSGSAGASGTSGDPDPNA